MVPYPISLTLVVSGDVDHYSMASELWLTLAEVLSLAAGSLFVRLRVVDIIWAALSACMIGYGRVMIL